MNIFELLAAIIFFLIGVLMIAIVALIVLCEVSDEREQKLNKEIEQLKYQLKRARRRKNDKRTNK